MKPSSKFLNGVDIQSNLHLNPGSRVSIIYPVDEVLDSAEDLLGMLIIDLKKTELFQDIMNTSVTRCPNVYASRSQNAFLTVNRKRYIADFEEGCITDIERQSKMKIVSNVMVDGIRYIGIEGIMIPDSVVYK